MLSKALARNLGNIIGELMHIDKDARDICDKILKARILLHIDQDLQRWITIQDEIREREVIVNVAYERLPNFCHHCGFIGHQDAECGLPEAKRMMAYIEELGVAPTQYKDSRCWPMPEMTGQELEHYALLWRNDLFINSRAHNIISPGHNANIARVSHNMANLSIQDKARKGKEKETQCHASSSST
jgi:hypothetical protein